MVSGGMDAPEGRWNLV